MMRLHTTTYSVFPFFFVILSRPSRLRLLGGGRACCESPLLVHDVKHPVGPSALRIGGWLPQS